MACSWAQVVKGTIIVLVTLNCVGVVDYLMAIHGIIIKPWVMIAAQGIIIGFMGAAIGRMTSRYSPYFSIILGVTLYYSIITMIGIVQVFSAVRTTWPQVLILYWSTIGIGWIGVLISQFLKPPR
jgi:hypothetical protein